jgi:hypothetical protein
MDSIVQVLLSWQLVFFGLAVSAIVYVLRIVVGYFIGLKGDPKASKLWNGLLLPILPVTIGALIASCIKSFPYPEGLVTKPDRFLFGLVAGLLSGLFYRVIKSMIADKIKSSIKNATQPSNDKQMPPRGQL